jgi:lysophospholipase L1-like esterase
MATRRMPLSRAVALLLGAVLVGALVTLVSLRAHAPFGRSRDSGRVLILGDSWTAGYGASRPDRGWAQITASRLHWHATVRGFPGAGYLRQSGGRSFAADFAAVPWQRTPPALVIVQGSTNDFGQPAADLPLAVGRVLAELAGRWPAARLVLVGPMAGDPADRTTALRVDDQVRAAAVAARATYLDALRLGWLPIDRRPDLIDPQLPKHPSDAGHAAIAAAFVAAVADLGLSART